MAVMLHQCTLGAVVKLTDTRNLSNVPAEGYIGHIIGFGTADAPEGLVVTIRVKWCAGWEDYRERAEIEFL